MARQIVKTDDLWFKGGSSNKVYHLALIDEGDGTFSVKFAYGPKGGTLQPRLDAGKDEKVSKASRVAAEKIYNKFWSEKSGEGYMPAPGVSGTVWNIPMAGSTPSPAAVVPVAAPPVTSREINPLYVPMLPNEIDEATALEIIATKPFWFMQEKEDGTHLTAVSDKGAVDGYNKKGQPTSVAADIAKSVASLAKHTGGQIALNGEAIGNVYRVWTILESGGKNLRGETLENAYFMLRDLLEKHPQKNIQLTRVAFGRKGMEAFLEKLRQENREGAILKNGDAIWESGKPASGGDLLKLKFKARIHAVVTGHTVGRRSVQISVNKPNGNGELSLVSIGKVSIQADKEIPAIGKIVDVQYLYCHSEDGCLAQPVYYGERLDVDASECLHSRLKFKAARAEVEEGE